MEGIVGCVGLVLDTEASPGHAAIDRAQQELRLEYSTREERRRELEFLEKGGNPLDFKFGHTASISVQSTSVTDHPAEQYVTSEAKGSFALPASPHGDSVESSGRPGGSGCGEPNAENSLLLDGENSFPDVEKNAKRKGKRGGIAVCEEYSRTDSSLNARGSEDSAILRLATKGQAYARRNRSRTTRGGANLGSSDSGLRHGYRASLLPTSKPGPTGANSLSAEVDGQAENRGVSAVYDSKASSPKGNIILKEDLASYSQTNMELENMNSNSVIVCIVSNKDGNVTDTREVKVTENFQGSVHNSCSKVDVGVPNGSISQSSDNNEKNEIFSDMPCQPLESIKIKSIDTVEKGNGSKASDLVMTEVDPDPKPSEKDGHGYNVIEDSIMDDIKEEDCTASTNRDNNIDADGDQSLILRSIEGSSDENVKRKPVNKENSLLEDIHAIKESHHIVDSGVLCKSDNESRLAQASNNDSLAQVINEVELCDDNTNMQGGVPHFTGNDSEKEIGSVSREPEMKLNNSVGEPDCIQEANIRANILVSSAGEVPETVVSRKLSASVSKLQNSAPDQWKLAKEHGDAILKEARRIEALRRRAGEQSLSSSLEKRYKCHWDFVLEEMTWMANDFMQERLWKITAAAQVSRWIATCGKSKFEQMNMQKQENIAKIIAKAVMQFWHSAEISGTKGKEPNGGCQEINVQLLKQWRVNKAEISKNQVVCSTKAELSGQVGRLAIQDYAVRFLKYHGSSSDCSVLAEAPATPDRHIDVGLLDMSWEDQLSEESLFYTVPPGAMRAYRESIESQSVHTKKNIITAHHEDCETSMCGSAAGPRENAYEEDEGDTSNYMLPGVSSGGLSSKHSHKKKKDIYQKSYGGRLYDVTDMSYEPCLESKPGAQPFLSNGKRPSNTLHVGSIPTKRIRTAARQRFVSLFTTGVSAPLDVATKTDASSGETTSSLQDDQSSLNGGFLSRKNFEVESPMDFEGRVAYDSSEIMKVKKKKKPKHFGYKNSANFSASSPLVVSGKGSSYEQRLQIDSIVKHEQKDHSRKRLEGQHFDSNGVAYGHNAAKRPKLSKQLPDTPPELFTPLTGSLTPPVASQMSNMSNSNRLIKMNASRDRGKKSKVLKLPAGQSGTGTPWSNFEDQALVVLVHDMGPNWELISDAINSTLQFKCIFRKPTECKERHKFLMDKSAGDGADSAEDSGSSQPYPSTLPGIPKGSARQLFQRLQGPMEEDTLKAHFEKIIFLRLHSSRRKNDQEAKQIIPPHSSHVVALSQVSMNNTNGGILMPLDFCDAIASSTEVFSLGYQGSHSSGLALPSHQGSGGPILPSTGVNTMLQGSPGIVLNSSLPSASAPLNHSPRDAQRYTMQRPPNLPIDDPQRVQQYGPILSGRNIQPTSIALPGSLAMGVDPGVRMLPSGTGLGMMCPINRCMPMPRPGFQGISPANMLSMVSTGSMLSNGGHGIQSSVNAHPNTGAGNSILRPRDPSQILRPGQNTEEQRQIMMQELQLQFSQGNSQTVIPFNAMSAPFSNATVAPPIQTFSVPHQQQSHQFPQQPHIHGNPHHPHLQGSNHTNSQQQAHVRFAKDRQLQQRIMPQSQNPFTGNNAIPSTHNNSQAQAQMQATPAVTVAPSLQAQHKQPNIPKNPQSGIPNPMMKQKQRQQVQQQQPKQQPLRQQGQPQAKLVKGLGRGSILMHQNLPGDVSQVGGLSTAPRNKVSGKHLMQQGQGFFSGNPGLNPALPQCGSQNKMYPRPLPQSSKPIVPVADNSNQGHTQGSTSTSILGSQQSPIAPSVAIPSEHQQSHQRYMSQPQQAIPKMLQQNRQMDHDVRSQPSTDSIQVGKMAAMAPASQSADLVTSAPMVSSTTQWKPESSYETSMPNSTGHAASSSPESMVGNDAVPHPSSQGIANRQISGGMSIHGHGLGGQWQQQSQPQQQQPKHQIRQVPRGNLFVQPSNSAPG